MKRFTTIIGRVSYSDEWDKNVSKAVNTIEETGGKLLDIKVSLSEMQIVAVIEWEDKVTKPKVKKAKPRGRSTTTPA
jgi:hypothetical protein